MHDKHFADHYRQEFTDDELKLLSKGQNLWYHWNVGYATHVFVVRFWLGSKKWLVAILESPKKNGIMLRSESVGDPLDQALFMKDWLVDNL